MTLVDRVLHGHLRRRLKLGQFERAKHISSHDEVTLRHSSGGVRIALIWVVFSSLSLVVKTRLVGNSYFSHFQFCALTVDIIIISHLRPSIYANLPSVLFFSSTLTFFIVKMLNFMLPLRGAQAVFTVVVLGLTAYGKSNQCYSRSGSRLAYNEI